MLATLTIVAIVLLGVADAVAGARVALVIGNSSYANASLLPNPKNDASAMAEKLRAVGFDDVTLEIDLDRRGMARALQVFSRKSAGADVAFLFFAGHGIELSGQNFLIPTDATLAADSDIDFEAIPLSLAMRSVEGAQKLRVIVLDACRNNPFATRMVRSLGTRSVGRGLARIEPPGDMLVAYSSKDGAVAEDGEGDHSPFTRALLDYLGQPGLEIQFLFRKVRDEVLRATANRQEPHVYGSLGGEPYFIVPPAPTSSAPAPSPMAAVPTRQIDALFWESVKDSASPADFEAYLQQFPQGVFAGLARNRLAALAPPAARGGETTPDASKPDAASDAASDAAVAAPAPAPKVQAKPAQIPAVQTPTVQAPTVKKPAAQARVEAPATAAASGDGSTAVYSRGSPAEESSTAVRPSGRADRRCLLILQRAQIGETLNADDRSYLATSCR